MTGLDIRIPMGAMFTLLGAILTGYGVATMGSPAYDRSLHINVNLWWGTAILAFGTVMLSLAWRAGRRPARPAKPAP